ncbi:hypothetical protein BpHYR1_013000 [Brachionus plicatilis]|uniref:Uncharacterized protein n=1 Tax=Brachionus plicatilis TaxID=10195 RepID=A0A3M7QGE1_BRAPC|nr:hypothetical protein BpHYR1_013000 [Brachionus plicatilis]
MVSFMQQKIALLQNVRIKFLYSLNKRKVVNKLTKTDATIKHKDRIKAIQRQRSYRLIDWLKLNFEFGQKVERQLIFSKSEALLKSETCLPTKV